MDSNLMGISRPIFVCWHWKCCVTAPVKHLFAEQAQNLWSGRRNRTVTNSKTEVAS